MLWLLKGIVSVSYQNKCCGYLKVSSQFRIKIKVVVTKRNRPSFYQKKGYGYFKEPSQFPIKIKVVAT